MHWQALIAGALTVLAPVRSRDGAADEDAEWSGGRAAGDLTRRMAATYEALGPPPSAGGDTPDAAARTAPAGPRLADRRSLAREYVEVGNTALAVRLFEQAYDQAPADPDVLSELADALAADGRYAEAETALRSALLMQTDRPPSLLPVAAFAWLLRLRGRAEEAETLTRPGLTRARLVDVLAHLDLPAPAAEDDDRTPPPLPPGPLALPAPPGAAPVRPPADADADSELTLLEGRVEDLRAFEREYRVRLTSFLESQLRQVEELSARQADTSRDAAGTAEAVRDFEREHLVRLRAFIEAQLRQVRMSDTASRGPGESAPMAYAAAAGTASGRPVPPRMPPIRAWSAGGGGPAPRTPAITSPDFPDTAPPPETTEAGLPRRSPRGRAPAAPAPATSAARGLSASRSRLARGLADGLRRREGAPAPGGPPPDPAPDDDNDNDGSDGSDGESGSGEGRD
ncbi:tetratricopeptide repeat protein [Streptomyces sp. NPDC090306]|uniref:tetratricopeptide repeat protein n=1 Tax=Streptomyces sp. NPDC090306 TaxID=3365961 RepID=UPI003826FF4F